MTTWLKEEFRGSHDVVFATLLDMYLQGLDQGDDTTQTLANLRAALDEFYVLHTNLREAMAE
jgi:hypothetical protein